jgi:pathogenesis-related protein 1
MKSLVLTCPALVLALAFISTTAIAQKHRPPIRHKPPKTSPKVITNCLASGLTDAEVADLLASHNKQRQKYHTPSLVWDCRLGAIAASWAAKGSFGHSGTDYGENIFVASDPNEKVAKAPDRWEDEEHNWNNKKAECDAGKVCTHFTQMVWRATRSIGCAVNRHVASDKWKLILVCNYDPAALSGPAY